MRFGSFLPKTEEADQIWSASSVLGHRRFGQFLLKTQAVIKQQDPAIFKRGLVVTVVDLMRYFAFG
jgi:hypothetical protein